MAIRTDAIGRAYAPTVYAVGREKIREYAEAVGETNSLYLDLDAARAAGHDDLVAPPMFAVIYAGRAVWPALLDPELELNFAMLVHGAQEFNWERLVIAGDEIATEVSVASIENRRGLGIYVLQSRSANQRGEPVCTGTWTNIVRGVDE